MVLYEHIKKKFTVVFNWLGSVYGVSVWLMATVPKEKWMWVFICDCLLPVTTLTALAHKAGDKNKILESYTTLLGEIRARERAVSPYQAPALPGSSGHRGLAPSTICQGALGFAHFPTSASELGTGGLKDRVQQASIGECPIYASSLLFSHSLGPFLDSALG